MIAAVKSLPARRWAGASFLLALGASLTLLLAPLGTSVEATTEQPSRTDRRALSHGRVTHTSLLGEQGWSVALPLSAPVLLAGAGLAAAWGGIHPVILGAALVLGAYIFVAALSVGVFYVPAEVALIVAAAKLHR